jgi:hypothetical protein
MFRKYLERWQLVPDGHPVIARTSGLLPVRSGGMPAMLKIAIVDEERLGGLLGGTGKARRASWRKKKSWRKKRMRYSWNAQEMVAA